MESMEQRWPSIEVRWYLARFVVGIESRDRVDELIIKDERLLKNLNQDLKGKLGKRGKAIRLCLSSLRGFRIAIRRTDNVDCLFPLGGLSQDQARMSDTGMRTQIFFSR